MEGPRKSSQLLCNRIHTQSSLLSDAPHSMRLITSASSSHLLGRGVLLGQQHADVVAGHAHCACSVGGQQPPRDALHTAAGQGGEGGAGEKGIA